MHTKDEEKELRSAFISIYFVIESIFSETVSAALKDNIWQVR